MHAQQDTVAGLFHDWFIDYASYVILERAVPHINDGLKPVQRRILHSLWELEDGRYNKVANVVGHCMKYHPHGDASIADALVQLGQRDILIDTQGNWGNTLTGDSAAASRYIEARLSKFALDVLYSPKITNWQASYDGRNKEPVTLPVKFPLVLAQGVEGIAVGLACKIMPHNFIELIDASIAVLKGKTPVLLPDFPTGASADFSDYQNGLRGGKIRVRAKIESRTKSLLAITEIPFGTTTRSIIDSIIAANAKEKIKIKKIEDNTANNVEILLHLPVGADPQKTISALYVFTDCEVVHSPNACVIRDNKPCFVDVIEMLKYSTQATEQLIKSELEIKLKELQASWHAATLERIFIEEKLYRIIEQSTTETDAIAQLHKALQPFRNLLHQDIHKEDIIRLIELKFRRLARYDVSRALQDIAKLEKDILDVNHHLTHLTNYTIQHFQTLKQKYSTGHERRTIAMQFDDIVASNVVVANEKLYINRLTGFIGYGLKDQELLGNCSTIDEVLVIYKNGQMKVSLVSDKAFFGKDIIYATILKKNDEVTTYNMAYTDGPAGFTYVKRFNVYGITRDKIYDLTQGTEGSTVRHWSVSPSEQEGPTIHAKLVATPGIRKTELSFDFATLAVKNRHAQGNILTKYAVKSIKT